MRDTLSKIPEASHRCDAAKGFPLDAVVLCARFQGQAVHVPVGKKEISAGLVPEVYCAVTFIDDVELLQHGVVRACRGLEGVYLCAVTEHDNRPGVFNGTAVDAVFP